MLICRYIGTSMRYILYHLFQSVFKQNTFFSEGSSPEFEDLINRLVDKNPATRIKWPVRIVISDQMAGEDCHI